MARFHELDSPKSRLVQWETREITMPSSMTRQQARQMLTEYAEYGHWELARLRLYSDGRRWALLRRRMMRVQSGEWQAFRGESETGAAAD